MSMPMMEKPSKKEQAEEQKRRENYQAEDDLRTLRSAEEIKADPERMKRAQAMAKTYASALGKGK